MKKNKALVAIMLLTTLFFATGCEKEKGSIFGMVTDFASGDPVAYANVQLRPSGETTLTGSDGMYEFLDVEAGDYSITVSKADYTDLVDSYVIELKPGKRMRRDVQIEKSPSYIHIYQQDEEITEIDFGSNNEINQKSFDLLNKGTKKYNYTISKTASWLSVNKPEGSIEMGQRETIKITIDRSKLPSEYNTTNLLITAEGGGSRELTVKAQKSGNVPVVNILEAIANGPTAYRIKCEVTSDGGQAVTERGVCFNTFGAPTTSDQMIMASNGGTGVYTVDMANLDTTKRYYVCAFAKNTMGPGYSSVMTIDPGTGSIVRPTVITSEVTDVTQTTAKGGGNVTDEGSSPVTERGICWGTNHNPTTADSHGHSGTGLGTYTVTMTGLSANTTYYVRAYATNAQGTSYGDEVNFNYNQNATVPTLTTNSVTDITKTSAKCGGNVTSAGGGPVTERGVCWSTSPNPTTSGNHLSSGAGGTGMYYVTITDLTPNTTYYVRAYAKNNIGTAYGNGEVFSTMPEAYQPEGALSGLFSISATQQVWFSQGNLQYIGSASPSYWRFAENQWDCLGTSTGQNSDSQNVDRDLFGWGTSGGYCDNTCYMPFEVSTNNYQYGPTGHDLTDNYADGDWGHYNAISNGGNTAGQWRTLSKAEWAYVMSTRSTASNIRFAKAVVNGVNGVIVLPDDWVGTNFALASINNTNANYGSNTISANDWLNILEPKGAVFLPAPGVRKGTTIENTGIRGVYWTTTFSYSGNAYGVVFSDTGMGSASTCGEWPRSNGVCVRLVYDFY